MTAVQDSQVEVHSDMFPLPRPAELDPYRNSTAKASADRALVASIVIVEFRSRSQVEEFLRHMASEQMWDVEFIVQRNSCDSSEPAIEYDPALRVRQYRDVRNLGFGAAFNKAVGKSIGEVILSCNSDTAPTREVLHGLISRARGARRLVAPVLFNDLGEERGRPFYSPVSMVSARIPKLRAKAITGRPDWVVGACFAISRTFFNELGGFHPAYKLYVEDVDLCWRVVARGGTVEVLPDSKVFHAHGRASRKVLSKPFAYHVRGGVMFFVLHPRAIVGLSPARSHAATARPTTTRV